MKTIFGVIVIGIICQGCLKPPQPGEIDAGAEIGDVAYDEADAEPDQSVDLFSADEVQPPIDDEVDASDNDAEAEACATDEVDADVTNDQDLSGETEVDSAADELDVGNESDIGKEIDALESEASDEVELLGDTDAAVDLDILDEASLPDINCPPGYGWDSEMQKCVSFCPADQYFEAKLMKCVFYPCCDLTGAWKARLLDTDTMAFTIYDLQVDQAVSYLQAVLMLDSPPEVAECSGLLENKELVLSCTSEAYSLLLNSTTVDTVNAVDTTGKFSGFYSFSYKKGGVKTGPVNFEKK